MQHVKSILEDELSAEIIWTTTKGHRDKEVPWKNLKRLEQ